MQEFENAIESALEAKGVAVLAACLTGSGTKEWRYYTSDKEEFMAKFNSGLKGHPAYPIRMQLFADPEWKALAELPAKSA